MVSNPMQKKARNSFLLGVVITLIICLVIGVLFYFLFIAKDKQKEEERGKEVTAYVLNEDVKSGQVITPNLLSPIVVYENMVPQNYINASSISNMELQDKNGNMLYTNSEGILYMVDSGNTEYTLVSTKTEDKNKVLIQSDSNGYYKTKKDGNGKEYIELMQVPVVSKIDMYKNSIITSDSVAKSDEVITDDLRYVEYNMLILPTTVAVGDYIDIRLALPNGQDLIVISKKEVKSLLGDTVGLQLSEGEILMMESAIVDAYIMTASKLYAIQYVEPGNQTAAVKTYEPTEAVKNLIKADKNIEDTAIKALEERYLGVRSSYIDPEKNNYAAEQQENIESGLQKEIENARAAREAYLNGLTSY